MLDSPKLNTERKFTEMPAGRQFVEFRIRVDCRRLTVASPAILRGLLRSLFTRFRIEADEAMVAFAPQDDCDAVVLKATQRD